MRNGILAFPNCQAIDLLTSSSIIFLPSSPADIWKESFLVDAPNLCPAVQSKRTETRSMRGAGEEDDEDEDEFTRI